MSKVIVITGGSAGIGAAAAADLVRRGHDVVIAARDADRLAAVAAPLGAHARTVVADVTRRADVERVRDEALAAFGRIDVWINNAGRGVARPVLALTDDDVDEIVAVNVKSVLYGVQAIVPYFQSRGSADRPGDGHIITISSFLARVPLAPVRSVYSAAKAAVNSLMTNLRMDLAPTHPGIHVSTIMPGVVLTDFGRNARGAPGIGAAPPPMPPGGTMLPQTADDVALVIARVIEHPVAEAYTNPASPTLARDFFDRIAAFEPLA